MLRKPRKLEIQIVAGISSREVLNIYLPKTMKILELSTKWEVESAKGPFNTLNVEIMIF